MSEKEKRLFLSSKKQAKSLVKKGRSVHTFRSSAFMLVGADWNRKDLLKAIDESTCEIGGEQCKAIKHGLVVHIGGAPLFVETHDDVDWEHEAAKAKLEKGSPK